MLEAIYEIGKIIEGDGPITQPGKSAIVDIGALAAVLERLQIQSDIDTVHNVVAIEVEDGTWDALTRAGVDHIREIVEVIDADESIGKAQARTVVQIGARRAALGRR